MVCSVEKRMPFNRSTSSGNMRKTKACQPALCGHFVLAA
jgi:hypothetical protein